MASDAPVTVLFRCPSCSKNLRVKSELAGRKIKCPGCTQVHPVPASSEATGPPTQEKEVTIDQIRPMASVPRGVVSGVTVPPLDDDEPEEELWDFLAPAQAPDELGRLGPYRVLKVLGHGGMGVVFLAEDPHLERRVALKAMLPTQAASGSAKKRFLREAKLAASLKHDHVVSIYQVGEDRGAPFLAMEFLEGESLDERIKREKTLPLPEVLRIGREIAEGLAAAHDLGLIHRDIKPGNIWLETRGQSRTGAGKTAKTSISMPTRVKILDFGLARGTSDRAHLTQSGAIIGTPAYMAPEQAAGKAVDPRGDLFSLGVVLYRLCTGQMPFKGENTLAILSALAMETPPSPREVNADVPNAMSETIMKLLEKDPESRYQSAQEVLEAFSGLEGATSTAVSTRPLPPAKRPTKPATQEPPSRRRGLWLMLGLGGFLAALVAGITLFVSTPHGTLRVEIDGDDIEVAVKGTEIRLKSGDGAIDHTVQAGPQVLQIRRGGDAVLETDKVAIKRGDKAVVRVALVNDRLSVTQDGQPLAEAKTRPVAIVPAVKSPFVATDLTPAQRKALDWVLSTGGSFTILENGKHRDIHNRDNLKKDLIPKGPLSITLIDLQSKPLANDVDIANLKGMPPVEKYLGLYGTRIGDAGLAILASDPSTASVPGLHLNKTPITDAGLATIAKFEKLVDLILDETNVSAKGLAHLGSMKLRALYLQGCRFVGDDAIGVLSEMHSLEKLAIRGTAITSDGFLRLRKALPKCFVDWTPSVSSPKPPPVNVTDDPDRRAGLWVLSAGGYFMTTESQGKSIQDVANVPPYKFEISAIGFVMPSVWITDDSLKVLRGLKRLKDVRVNAPNMTDAGLAVLLEIPTINGLQVMSASITSQGLEKLRGRSGITALTILSCPIDDKAADVIGSLRGLKSLGVNLTKMTPRAFFNAARESKTSLNEISYSGQEIPKDAFESLGDFSEVSQAIFPGCNLDDDRIRPLASLKKLRFLALSSNPITDDGLVHLEGLSNLTTLNLIGTKVTADGVAKLKKALPNCVIHWGPAGVLKKTSLDVNEYQAASRPIQADALCVGPAAERSAWDFVVGTTETLLPRIPRGDSLK